MRHRTFPTLLLLVLAIPVFLPGSAACQPDRYAPVLKRLHSLRGSPYARLMQVGNSKEGRPILAVLLTDPENPQGICSDRARVLLLAGQHGNEPSAVMSMLDLAEQLARTENPIHQAVLKKVVLIIVPAVNPDGFSHFGRNSGGGADLNRNWSLPSQPETLAVSRLASKLRPHVVVDQHEWLDSAHRWAEGVEIAGFGRERQYKLARVLAQTTTGAMPQSGPQLAVLRYRKDADHRLAHRHFAQQGICSMLVETSPRWSPQARAQAYRDFVTALAVTLAFPPDMRIAEGLEAAIKAGGEADPVVAALYTPEPSWPYLPIPTSCCVALFLTIGYIVLRYAESRERTEPLPNPRVHPVRITISDALKLSASPRMKVAVIRRHRPRPSDRKKVTDQASQTNGRAAPYRPRSLVLYG